MSAVARQNAESSTTKQPAKLQLRHGVFGGPPSSSATPDIDVRSPEMAHFLAQNLIAPRGLFSEN